MTVFFHAHIDELEYMLRIAIAALCGGIIGFERSRMRKEAGLRTHIIVAVDCFQIRLYGYFGYARNTGGWLTRGSKCHYGDFLPWGGGYLRARCFY